MGELSQLSVVEVAAGLENKDFSALELAAALLARCRERIDLNAFCWQDEDKVMAAAGAADAARAAGARAPLLGVPLAIKANIETEDEPTSAATRALENFRPPADAPVAARLHDAGAIFLGKTNMHEMAFGATSNNAFTGPVRNPYDTARIPGGSSGGTAAAVAAHLAPAGLGTDTGGSVRNPAALCGITGFRPTVGRYPVSGIVPLSHTRDTAGAMAREVADVIVLDRIMAGAGDNIEAAGLKGLRLGVMRRHYYDNLDGGVAAVAEDLLGRLADCGVELIEADIDGFDDLCEKAAPPLRWEIKTDLADYLHDRDLGITVAELTEEIESPDVAVQFERLLAGELVSEAAYRDAIDIHRPALQAAIKDYFDHHDIAATIAPTTILPAALIGEDETVVHNGERVATFPTFGHNSGPAAAAGNNGLSLPAGMTPDGLPVGITIEGLPGHDAGTLAVGLAVEAVAPAIPPPGGG